MLLTAFFLSGAAALIYETLFVRVFALAFGHTTVAVASVLTAFMGGLALGSFLGGTLARRLQSRSLITAFIVVECATALTAALALAAAQAVALYVPVQSPLAWFLTAIGIVIIPTTGMGVTLPLLVRWRERRRATAATAVSVLYGVNTAGAVAGVLYAGFIGIAQFGMSRTLLVAVTANLAAAIAAYLVRAHSSSDVPVMPAPHDEYPPAARFLTGSSAAGIVATTGAAAMLCEVAWTREFSLLLGSSTYAFAIMLAIFLTALAAGSFSFTLAHRIMRPGRAMLAATLACTAAGLILYLPVFNVLPFLYVKLSPLVTAVPRALPLAHGMMVAVIMALPVFCMGFLLPLAVAVTRRDAHCGAPVGLLYMATTLGNIAGSALAGLLCVPLLGAEHTLVIAGCLYAACALSIAWGGVRAEPWKIAGVCLATTVFSVAVFVRPRWDPLIRTSGVFLYAPDYASAATYASFVRQTHAFQLLFHADGVNSTVAVLQTPWGERFMRINGKTDASTATDTPTQLLQGYLPLLTHQGQPLNALVIGLGSGMTAGALASAPSLRTIDCIEIEPAVVSAASLFGRYNHYVLDDSRLRIISTDARHYLAVADKKYDIISSEPSNPWIAGVAQLFTREAFELVRSRLTDNGVFCQWFHSYSMGEDDFKMVMRTFAGVFPHVMLMTTSQNDFFLLGSRQPWRIDYPALQNHFETNPVLSQDLRTVGLGNPFILLATTFLLENDAFRTYAGSGRIHTDDHPTLEFSAPRYLYRGQERQIFAGVVAARTSLLPPGLTGFTPSPQERVALLNTAGEAFMRSQNLAQATVLFDQALTLDRANAQTLTNLGRVYNLTHEGLKAREALQRALGSDPTYAQAWFHLGILNVAQGKLEQGIGDLESGLRLAPYDPMGNLQAALAYLKQGQRDKAVARLRKALSRPIANMTLRRSLAYTLGVATR